MNVAPQWNVCAVLEDSAGSNRSRRVTPKRWAWNESWSHFESVRVPVLLQCFELVRPREWALVFEGVMSVDCSGTCAGPSSSEAWDPLTGPDSNSWSVSMSIPIQGHCVLAAYPSQRTAGWEDGALGHRPGQEEALCLSQQSPSPFSFYLRE